MKTLDKMTADGVIVRHTVSVKPTPDAAPVTQRLYKISLFLYYVILFETTLKTGKYLHAVKEFLHFCVKCFGHTLRPISLHA